MPQMPETPIEAVNFSQLWLDSIEIGIEWQKILVPTRACTSIELTADVDWEWCTDTQGATRAVAAGVREPIVDTRIGLFGTGTHICWVRAGVPGTLWRKFY